MYHNRTYKNKINRLRERCLRSIYNDERSSFEYLSFEYLQALAIEMFKVPIKTSPEKMHEVFHVKQQESSGKWGYPGQI